MLRRSTRGSTSRRLGRRSRAFSSRHLVSSTPPNISSRRRRPKAKARIPCWTWSSSSRRRPCRSPSSARGTCRTRETIPLPRTSSPLLIGWTSWTSPTRSPMRRTHPRRWLQLVLVLRLNKNLNRVVRGAWPRRLRGWRPFSGLGGIFGERPPAWYGPCRPPRPGPPPRPPARAPGLRAYFPLAKYCWRTVGQHFANRAPDGAYSWPTVNGFVGELGDVNSSPTRLNSSPAILGQPVRNPIRQHFGWPTIGVGWRCRAV